MNELPASIEIVRPNLPRGRFGAVMFDFDGTLSLVRGGWMELMTNQMVLILRHAGATEAEADLRERIVAFLLDLVGQPTIMQMHRLAHEVTRLGATPRPATAYLEDFLTALQHRIEERLANIRTGTAIPGKYRVPGTIPVLTWLRQRSIPVVLASGTERVHVVREATALELIPFFGDAIHGPEEGRSFAKRDVIAQTLDQYGLNGDQIIGFGDGVNETEEIKRVGGLAVAVASDESGGGIVDPIKRKRLIEAGADIVIPDYRDALTLLPWLFTR